MYLAAYIEKKKLTVPEAAKQIGCTRGHLWRLTKRWQRPRPELANIIIAWSDGKIRLQDLMDVLPDRPRQRAKKAT